MLFNRKIAVAALSVGTAIAAGLGASPARAADVQESFTLVNHPAADISDVYAFPSPKNSANVVIVMNTNPLIPARTTATFDPSVLYQFKMSHSAGPTSTTSTAGSTNVEDTVIQFSVDSRGTGQRLTMYGPAAPRNAGASSTVVASTPSKPIPFNQATSLTVNGPDGKPQDVMVFAGERADPDFFDLARFYAIFPDRSYANHATGFPIPAPTAQAFRGFPAGNANSCPTDAASDFFSSGGAGIVQTPAGGYNVLSIVVEMPKSLLAQSGSPTQTGSYVHLWATTSTVSGV